MRSKKEIRERHAFSRKVEFDFFVSNTCLSFVLTTPLLTLITQHQFLTKTTILHLTSFQGTYSLPAWPSYSRITTLSHYTRRNQRECRDSCPRVVRVCPFLAPIISLFRRGGCSGRCCRSRVAHRRPSFRHLHRASSLILFYCDVCFLALKFFFCLALKKI